MIPKEKKRREVAISNTSQRKEGTQFEKSEEKEELTVLRSSTTFGHSPINILRRDLYITKLAMYTILMKKTYSYQQTTTKLKGKRGEKETTARRRER